jgi:hypothetical protein
MQNLAISKAGIPRKCGPVGTVLCMFLRLSFSLFTYVFDISNEAKVYVPENFADEKFWCRHYADDILP